MYSPKKICVAISVHFLNIIYYVYHQQKMGSPKKACLPTSDHLQKKHHITVDLYTEKMNVLYQEYGYFLYINTYTTSANSTLAELKASENETMRNYTSSFFFYIIMTAKQHKNLWRFSKFKFIFRCHFPKIPLKLSNNILDRHKYPFISTSGTK